MCLPNRFYNSPGNFSSCHTQLKLDFLDYFWFSGSAYRGSGVGEGCEMGCPGDTKADTYVGANVPSS